MSIPSNRPLFERLAARVADKNVLDDTRMQPKNIFQKLTFDFYNDSIQVQLPPNSIDVEGWEILDPNDSSRIRIHRDCMLFLYLFELFCNYFFSNIISHYLFQLNTNRDMDKEFI